MWYSAVGFIVTLTLSLLSAPITVTAQPRSTVPRIGILTPAAEAGVREGGVSRVGCPDGIPRLPWSGSLSSGPAPAACPQPRDDEAATRP